ncbi:MAG: hypothetical protein IKZ82_10165 [Clostridia bacterium]|nr:hypothetical protein [Clostridia bacterium]
MSKEQIHIQTENGIKTLDLDITLDNEDTDEASIMTIRTNYQGKEIVAVGDMYPWTDAFGDLQKQLPKNVFIVSCLACRYGNMCPVGNAPNEVFCTKDVSISEKRDLWFYTEDEKERVQRSRKFTDYCDDFKHQTCDFYTYNDYSSYRK